MGGRRGERGGKGGGGYNSWGAGRWSSRPCGRLGKGHRHGAWGITSPSTQGSLMLLTSAAGVTEPGHRGMLLLPKPHSSVSFARSSTPPGIATLLLGAHPGSGRRSAACAAPRSSMAGRRRCTVSAGSRAAGRKVVGKVVQGTRPFRARPQPQITLVQPRDKTNSPPGTRGASGTGP